MVATDPRWVVFMASSGYGASMGSFGDFEWLWREICSDRFKICLLLLACFGEPVSFTEIVFAVCNSMRHLRRQWLQGIINFSFHQLDFVHRGHAFNFINPMKNNMSLECLDLSHNQFSVMGGIHNKTLNQGGLITSTVMNVHLLLKT